MLDRIRKSENRVINITVFITYHFIIQYLNYFKFEFQNILLMYIFYGVP